MISYDNEPFSAFQAKEEAQKLAFAPILFHCARTLHELGILAALDRAGDSGMSAPEVAAETGVSEYGVKVLLDMALSGHIVIWDAPNYKIAKVGHFLEHDAMTREYGFHCGCLLLRDGASDRGN